ncbi:MAG: YidC/Oxa1 family insertase periplasmic-domain containing protein [Opitutales bacterium]|nr:YidC/Oxa1 family insertase periplasmic-domain containing protein [Opitutales bacterium]
MDKKNFLIGMTLLMAAFIALFIQSYQQEQRRLAEQGPTPAETEPTTDQPEVGEVAPPPEPEEQRELTEEEITPEAEEPTPAVQEAPRPDDFAEQVSDEPEEEIILENEFMRVHLTRQGGAIRRVEMIEEREDGSLVYPRELDSDEPFIFNRAGFAPALSIIGLQEFDPLNEYSIRHQDERSVTFSLRLANGLEIRRAFMLLDVEGRRDPNAYMIHHQTRFLNRSDAGYIPLDTFGVNLGTSGPSSERESRIALHHLTFGHYDGNRARFIGTHRFRGGGFLHSIGVRTNPARPEIGEDQPVVWGVVKNQFFAGLLTPEEPAVGYVSRPFRLPGIDGGDRREGITGELLFDLRGVSPGEAAELNLDYYVGPKEFSRLDRLDQRQDLVMQFGIVGFFSKILLAMMIGIQSLPMISYGLAIVITTIIIKAILWPLTAKVARSSKRMAKIAEPMKALREKYKDNPQKMQMETMKLFKENKVNPFAGCLPIFIQLPIFFALFRMLQSSAELRFENFLWVDDLSAADTIGYIFGLPINVMPVLMGVTMFLQMKMMPMSTANPMQQKIFLFMPPVITIVLYNFSAGLTLYWTVNNLLTILQQYLINKQKDPELENLPAVTGEEEGDKKPSTGTKKGAHPTRKKKRK